MENYRAMAIFVQVVECGSFSAAARRLGITKSAVSQKVSLLEEELGTRLLQRTTRKLSVTEAGDLYLVSCRQMVEAAQRANQQIGQYRQEPSGTLRISCSQDFAANHLVPVLAPFLEQHPKLSLEIDGTDEVVDLVEEQVDLAIRIGHLPESGLVVRKLSDIDEVLVASPAYLEKHGTPQTPVALVNHQWITFTRMAQPRQINMTSRQGQQQKVRLYGRAQTNSASTAHQMAVNSMGITRLLKLMVQKDLQEGLLVQVLPCYQLEPSGLYVVYPQREHMPLKVRAAIDYLVENRHMFEAESGKSTRSA